MTTASYGTNFRRAEEASNAEGMTKAALDFALKNAKENPTKANLAILADTSAARQQTLIAQGKSPEQIAEQVKAIVDGLPAQTEELNNIIKEADTAIAGVNAAGAEVVAAGGTFEPVGKDITKDGRDAFALLEQTFKQYGLEELVPAIKRYMSDNLGPNQATLELRKEPAYIARFKGNDIRRNAGLNALSESEYLALEDSYSQTLRAFGVQTYLGADAKTRQKAMSDIIGSDISATEFKDRIDTVVTRVTNADPAVKQTLRTFYDIKDEDLTGYFLNPKENLPKLQEKVTAAEIGAAAKAQSLTTSAASAAALAQFGITKEQAQAGYATIGEVMPTASKLGQIYNDEYTQSTAEQEVFKGTASAKRKRQQLAEREVASFSGSSGRARTGQPQTNSGMF
jgi:hypothetical protein